MKRVRLLVFNAGLEALDYKVPSTMRVEYGSLVIAPLGPRKIQGIVWEEDHLPGDAAPAEKLRALIEVLPIPPLQPQLRRLIEWTADYYCAPLTSVARMVLSSAGGSLGGSLTTTEYRLSGQEPPRMTPQRAAALDALPGEQATIRELAEQAGVSEAVLRGLVSCGALEPVEVKIDCPYPPAKSSHYTTQLSAEQGAVSSRLVRAVEAQEFAPFLLDGVTGSGKTETYFEPLAAAIDAGQQVLVLLPEIALTQAFLSRFEQRFGAPPVLWHSALKSTERRRAWRAIANGEAQVVVGARSALFLPYSNLGLLIVDEAHEISFKQDDGVRYNARDVAVMRARYERIPVILASATPALESLHMAGNGIYERLELPSRYGGAQLPTITRIDLTENPPERGRWLADPLVQALQDRLHKGEQSLLFLNRRGFAPLTLCRSCGFRFKCPNCSAWLVEHRFSRSLNCHHCGHDLALPNECPECEEPDCLVACGPGVERIGDEVAELFPQARVAIATSDTIGTAEKAAAFVADAHSGKVDVIVGTQLVTKGFHFPELTLVGVVDADLGLEGGDLRSAERSYQQIAQVAGRAGRAAKPGEVFLQTRHPEEPVIAALAAGDREEFYRAESEARKSAGAPPFGRWAAIIISSENEDEAKKAAYKIGKRQPHIDGIQVLGPAPAPLSLLRGRYRFRLLVNARREAALQDILRQWLGGVSGISNGGHAQEAGGLYLPRSVRVAIDIDPYSFV